jgi:hypothetical protein
MRSGAHEMRHDRDFIADLKRSHFLFQRPIGKRHALMLPQMLDPVLGNECLNVPRWIGRIGELLPEQKLRRGGGLGRVAPGFPRMRRFAQGPRGTRP